MTYWRYSKDEWKFSHEDQVRVSDWEKAGKSRNRIREDVGDVRKYHNKHHPESDTTRTLLKIDFINGESWWIEERSLEKYSRDCKCGSEKLYSSRKDDWICPWCKDE